MINSFKKIKLAGIPSYVFLFWYKHICEMSSYQSLMIGEKFCPSFVF